MRANVQQGLVHSGKIIGKVQGRLPGGREHSHVVSRMARSLQKTVRGVARVGQAGYAGVNVIEIERNVSARGSESRRGFPCGLRCRL